MTNWKGMLAPFVLLSSAIALEAHAAPPQFEHAIPNIPGKSLVAVEVTMAPGQRGAPHRHARSAFIYIYVLSGAIRSQIEGEPAHDYRAGESWYENPGAHHILSENLSKTEPAKFLAVFVLDSDDKTLTVRDQ
jgi:quercetin dioxygenase-like cupin family protein